MKTSAATAEVKYSYACRSVARKVPVALGVAFVIYGVVGAVVAPPIVKHAIASRLSEKLGRPVQVDRVSVNPYTLEASVDGLRVLEPDGRNVFASFDHLDIDGSVRSLARLAPVADSVTLDGLKVNLVRDKATHYNFSDILVRLSQSAKPGKKEKDEEPRFSLSNIRITRASLAFDDRPNGARHEVKDIDVAIPFVSNLPSHLKEYVQPRFFARVNGAPLAIRGETLPFERSLRTRVTLRLDGFDIKRYAAYSPSPLPVEVRSGKLAGDVQVRFAEAGGSDPAIELSGSLSLADLEVATPSGESARAGKIEAHIASLQPLAGTGNVDAVQANDLQVGPAAWRVGFAQARGIGLDLHAKKISVGAVEARDGVVALHRTREGIEMPIKISAPAEPATEHSSPWHIEVASAGLDAITLSLADDAVKPSAKHSAVIDHLQASGLSNAAGAKSAVQASIALEHGGVVEVRSDVSLDPFAVDAQLDARRVDLVPFRPYVSQFQTVALKSGRASAKGRLQVSDAKALKIAYEGTAQVSKLATFDTVNDEDLLNWEDVRAQGLRVRWAPDAPLDLVAGEIAVDRAYSRVVVTPEGKINLQTLKLATPGDPTPEPQSPDSVRPRNVRIERIVFKESRLNFTDHFIKPNYTADVGGLAGSVTGLSSQPEARARVELRGSYDKSAPVVITGTVNPLRGDLFLDVAAKGSDIALPRLSAYSMRYAGYPIKEGKLTLDVKYHVEDGKLDGRNNIVLDQLVFGDKVESPDATTLPVLFAVNLLKDANGRINLELPIKGSLEDPQFDLGAVIGTVVSNLLKKAVTAPFQLLAAAFGGGGNGGSPPGAASGHGADDLAFVAFEPGRTQPSDAEQAKLDRISKALLDRPALKLEMAARFDPERDLAALQTAVQGPVNEEELRALAQKRAAWVRSYLVAKATLPEDRVLVASADLASKEQATHVSRVDFTLK